MSRRQDEPGGFDSVETWPDTGNPERRRVEFLKWKEAARRLDRGEDRDFAETLSESAGGRAMLACVFGASPFLSNCLIRDPGFLRRLWLEGPDRCMQEIYAGVEALPADADKETAGRILREARRRTAVAVALADIAGLWELEAVTGALSRLADAACSAAFRVLLTRLADRGAFSPADPKNPEEGSGLIALGLGKLGGRELNYSSDIDLVLLYDSDRVPAQKPYEMQSHFLRLARSFIALLSEPTVQGMAFRVDLRLRPDPLSTPLVISTNFAERYYQERGQTWERVALIKARPIAGDLRAAERFLKRISSFVWRRVLDFAAMRDLHDIKRRIDAQHGSGAIGARGHNLKLGRGGIREIEFFVQIHQLIWGGKNRRLRKIPTCDSLRALTAAGHVPSETTESLIAAYRFLRRAEHRVQMVADKQTHSLPKDAAEYETLARFLGYRDGRTFSGDLIGCLQQVELQYESFFEFPFPVKTATASASPDFAEEGHLRRMGFGNPGAAARVVEKWRDGRCPAARAPRSRELLQALASPLVIAMSGTTDPDLAIERFDRLLDNLPDGLQIFSLFQANLHAMESAAEIMVSAPAVNDLLAARPTLLETLVDPGTDAVAPAPDLAAHLEPADGYEDFLDRLEEWVDGARFRVCVRLLFHSLDPLDAPRLLSGIADCALAALHERAETEFAARFGRIEGAATALVAAGSLASRAMTLASELELLFLYDAPEDAESDGPEKLPAPIYFDRFLTCMLSALGSRRGLSDSYKVALLFPRDENAGPCAVGLAAFERLLYASAGPRERSASARARAVVCSGAGAARLQESVRGVSLESLDPQQLRRDLAAAGARIAETPACCRGGLDAIEALTQYLLLCEAPGVPAGGTNGEAIAALANRGALSGEDAKRLLDAWQLWTRIRALQDLIGENTRSQDAPARLRPLLQSAAAVDSFQAFEPRMEAAAAAVQEICARVLRRPLPEPHD